MRRRGWPQPPPELVAGLRLGRAIGLDPQDQLRQFLREGWTLPFLVPAAWAALGPEGLASLAQRLLPGLRLNPTEVGREGPLWALRALVWLQTGLQEEAAALAGAMGIHPWSLDPCPGHRLAPGRPRSPLHRMLIRGSLPHLPDRLHLHTLALTQPLPGEAFPQGFRVGALTLRGAFRLVRLKGTLRAGRLVIEDCPNLTALPGAIAVETADLLHLPALRRGPGALCATGGVHFHRCDQLDQLRFRGRIDQLTISCCAAFQRLAGTARIRRLVIEDCPQLARIQLRHPPRELVLRRCPALHGAAHLATSGCRILELDACGLAGDLKLPPGFHGELRILAAPRLRRLRVPSRRLAVLHLEDCGVQGLPANLACGTLILKDLPDLRTLPAGLDVGGSCLLDGLPSLAGGAPGARFRGELLLGDLGGGYAFALESPGGGDAVRGRDRRPRTAPPFTALGTARHGSLNPRLVLTLRTYLWGGERQGDVPAAPTPPPMLRGTRLLVPQAAPAPALQVSLWAAFRCARALGRLPHLVQLILEGDTPSPAVFTLMEQLELTPREALELGAFLAVRWSGQAERLRLLEQRWLEPHRLVLGFPSGAKADPPSPPHP